jgi:hypothetical protein
LQQTSRPVFKTHVFVTRGKRPGPLSAAFVAAKCFSPLKKMDRHDVDPMPDEVEVTVPLVHLRRLLELLEVAARRGTYELEEFQRVGALYDAVAQCLPPMPMPSSLKM